MKFIKENKRQPFLKFYCETNDMCKTKGSKFILEKCGSEFLISGRCLEVSLIWGSGAGCKWPMITLAEMQSGNWAEEKTVNAPGRLNLVPWLVQKYTGCLWEGNKLEMQEKIMYMTSSYSAVLRGITRMHQNSPLRFKSHVNYSSAIVK